MRPLVIRLVRLAGFISLQDFSHLRPGSLLQQREKLHCSDDNISYSGRRQQTMVGSSAGGGGRPADSLRPRLIFIFSQNIVKSIVALRLSGVRGGSEGTAESGRENQGRIQYFDA